MTEGEDTDCNVAWWIGVGVENGLATVGLNNASIISTGISSVECNLALPI